MYKNTDKNKAEKTKYGKKKATASATTNAKTEVTKQRHSIYSTCGRGPGAAKAQAQNEAQGND